MNINIIIISTTTIIVIVITTITQVKDPRHHWGGARLRPGPVLEGAHVVLDRWFSVQYIYIYMMYIYIYIYIHISYIHIYTTGNNAYPYVSLSLSLSRYICIYIYMYTYTHDFSLLVCPLLICIARVVCCVLITPLYVLLVANSSSLLLRTLSWTRRCVCDLCVYSCS